MELQTAIHNCRAMRRLKPDPVARDVIEALLDAANQGPSASNRQHDRWLVIQDPAKRLALAELNRSAIAGSYGPLPESEKQSAFEWQFHNLEHVPVHIVACLKLDEYNDSFHGGVAAGGSIWGKVQNLLLTARELGLGACPTTLPLQPRDAAKEALGVPDNVEPFCLIPLGYPMGNFGPVTRKPLDWIAHWDEWGEKG
jgi:nitroreductase